MVSQNNDSEELMLEEEIGIRDLVRGGTQFTIKSNFQEHRDDDELFPELLTGEEGISLDSDVIVSPWDMPFAELIPLMTNIGENIYKKIVKKPIDNVEIQGRCRVTIHYNAYYERETSPYDSTFMRGSTFTFVTNDNEVLPGLELAVRSMKREEESQFIIPYELLYGKHGCEPRIKKEADCLFVIHLIKFYEIGDEVATDKIEDKEDRRKYHVMIGKIMDVKASGIDHFRQKSYVKAAAAFHRAINSLEMCQVANETEEKEQQEHLIKLYVNAMTSYNKMENPKKACSAFNELCRLTNPNTNAKALFQHGKALLTLGEFNRAKEQLKKANRLKPNDDDIVEQMRILNIKHANHSNAEKILWQKAFGNDENTLPQQSFEVSESFKDAVNDIITEFKGDTKSKQNLPDRLSNDEKAYIHDLVKDQQMKLVTTAEIHGKKSCYLVKL